MYQIHLNETQHIFDIVAGVVPALADAKVHIAANEPGIPIYFVDVLALGETLLARDDLQDLQQQLKAYEEKLLHHQIALPSKLASKLAAYSAKLKHTIEVEDSRKFLLSSGGENHVKKIHRERMAAVQPEAQRAGVERQQLEERKTEFERQCKIDSERLAVVEQQAQRAMAERQPWDERKTEFERQCEYYETVLRMAAAMPLETENTRVERQPLDERKTEFKRQCEHYETHLRKTAVVQLEIERAKVERQQSEERKTELERQYGFYKKKLLVTHQRMKTCQTKSKEAGHCAKRNPVAFSKRRSDLHEQFKEDAHVCGLK
jgi:hypothetical protein